jgi:hypothetical protein
METVYAFLQSNSGTVAVLVWLVLSFVAQKVPGPWGDALRAILADWHQKNLKALPPELKVRLETESDPYGAYPDARRHVVVLTFAGGEKRIPIFNSPVH